MKKNIMQKWTKALRSGKYSQCTEKLCEVDGETGKESYCCLGVLTDLYLKERKRQKKGHGIENFYEYTGMDREYDHDYSKWEINGEDGVLPYEVAVWAGFNTATQEYKTGCFSNGKTKIDLAGLNDGPYDPTTGKQSRRRSFKQIASVIEKNYEHI